MVGKLLNILLVEDSETDAYMFRRILDRYQRRPCRLQHVGNMADAETFLKNSQKKGEPVDIILLDLNLPDTVDSADTSERLERTRSGIPVVVMTSVSDPGAEMTPPVAAGGQIQKSSIGANPEMLWDAIDFALRQQEFENPAVDESAQGRGKDRSAGR